MSNRISLVMAMLSRTSASTKPLDLESLIFGCAPVCDVGSLPKGCPGNSRGAQNPSTEKMSGKFGKIRIDGGEENLKKLSLKMSTSAWTEDDRGAFYACSIVRQS